VLLGDFICICVLLSADVLIESSEFNMTLPVTSLSVLLISSRGDFGGGPEHMFRLCEGLLKHGIRVFVALPKEEPYWEKFVSLLGEKSCFEIPHRKFAIGPAARLLRWVSYNKIQLVHSHGKGAATYARLLAMLNMGRLNGVHTAHGIHVGQYGPVSLFLYRIYENVTASVGTQHVIFVSESERAKANEIGLWLKKDCSVIFNGVNPGVDLRQLANDERVRFVRQRRTALGLPQDRFLVVTISRFDLPKNMSLAYRIAKALPELTFVWIGDGDDRGPLQKKAAEEGTSNIVFVGFRHNPQDYLAACDAYLSTSIWEGLPLAVLEAMANGLPLVASNVVGNRDILALSEKLMGYPLDEPEIAIQQLQQLASSECLRQEIAGEVIELHRRYFSLGTMIRKTIEVYCRVIN
jgi:glycosyltransferase involved in cell wall biosynthesis